MKSERYFKSRSAKVLWDVKQHVRRTFSSDWGLVFTFADIKADRVIPVSPHLIEDSGFKNMIVLSAALYDQYVKPYAGQKRAEADFLPDMLWLLRLKAAGCNAGRMNFKASFSTSDGEQKDVHLRVVIGTSDKIETGPVMKILLPGEE